MWTPQQIHDFVPYLYNALAASNVASTKILLPEDEFWQTELYSTTMSDPAVAPEVGIVACHDYYGAPAVLPTYDNPDAAVWETEVSTFDTFDGSISNAIYWANQIHLFMTVAKANAYHYWWLIPWNGAGDNEGLTDDNGIPAKRMYAFGNFSRFVLPGFYRICVTSNGFTSTSAYKDTNSGNFAIVAINSTSTNVIQTFDLTNFTAASVTPWITSGTLSLVSQAPVAVANSSFTYELPPLSVVTFVGQGTAPQLSITISNAVFNGNGFVFNWNSVAGAFYSVLKTNVLTYPTANWPAIITSYPAGGAVDGSLSYTDTTATVSTGPSFYQVRSP